MDEDKVVPNPSAGSRRKTTLTREDIVGAAERIANSQGLDAITMRRIATELSVAPMTLYTHVRSKDEILDALADSALGSVRLPLRDDIDVESSIREVAWAFLDLMRRSPVVVRLLSSRLNRSHESQRAAMESVLQHLAAAGLTEELCVRVYGFLIMYAMGFTSYQERRAWGRDDSPDSLEQKRQLSHYYAGLPADVFPTIIELAETLPRLPEDSTFWFGVDALITSVEVQLSDASR